jgi:hypothetical protein
LICRQGSATTAYREEVIAAARSVDQVVVYSRGAEPNPLVVGYTHGVVAIIEHIVGTERAKTD